MVDRGNKGAGVAPPGSGNPSRFDLPSLRVLGPPPDCIFLMKLYAGRAPDFDDMVTLWPLCTFASASEAAERFVTAYPQAPPDPDLIPYITEIAEVAAAAAVASPAVASPGVASPAVATGERSGGWASPDPR